MRSWFHPNSIRPGAICDQTVQACGESLASGNGDEPQAYTSTPRPGRALRRSRPWLQRGNAMRLTEGACSWGPSLCAVPVRLAEQPEHRVMSLVIACSAIYAYFHAYAFCGSCVLRRISSAIIAMVASTLCEPMSPSPRFLTEKVPLFTSFSPITSMYGIFSSCASRIL